MLGVIRLDKDKTVSGLYDLIKTYVTLIRGLNLRRPQRDELLYVTCLAIRTRYLILPPTARNRAFRESLIVSGLDSLVLDRVLDGDHRERTTGTLQDVIRRYVTHEPNAVEAIVNELLDHYVVIARDDALDDYLNALRVMIRLSEDGTRGTKLKGISYTDPYNGLGTYDDPERPTLVDYLTGVLQRTDPNVTVRMIDFPIKTTTDFNVRIGFNYRLELNDVEGEVLRAVHDWDADRLLNLARTVLSERVNRMIGRLPLLSVTKSLGRPYYRGYALDPNRLGRALRKSLRRGRHHEGLFTLRSSDHRLIQISLNYVPRNEFVTYETRRLGFNALYAFIIDQMTAELGARDRGDRDDSQPYTP